MKCAKSYLLLFILFGIVAFLIPYVYLLMPVYEANQCWIYFIHHSPIVPFGAIDQKTYCIYKEINHYMFIFFNWVLMIIFVGMYLLIQQIKDELQIKKELFWIIILWSLTNIIYFTLNQIEKAYEPDSHTLVQENSTTKFIKWSIFLTMIVRDFLAITVQTFFCWRVTRKEHAFYIESEFLSPLLVYDFELVLASVLPMTYFEIFVDKKCKDGKPYLDMF